MDELTVYRQWPTEVINEAVSEFNYQMHDGAGINEIRAGLHGLDFLTRASVIGDCLHARLDGAITEAVMRIELLAAKEADSRTQEENHQRALKAVGMLHRQIEAFHLRFIDRGAFDEAKVRELVRRRIERKFTS